MDREELLERYAAGERNFAGVDLRDENLSDMDLRGINLNGARLNCARFAYTLMNNASLINTIMIGVYTERADFGSAILTGAILRNSSLFESNFVNCVLEEADMRDACLKESTFENANLRNANLERVAFGEASFDGANLEGAILKQLEAVSDVTWHRANLTNAILDETATLCWDETTTPDGRIKTMLPNGQIVIVK